jgi:tetratricopeptide (TPR) repeat protein
MFIEEGKTDKAIKHWTEAVRIKPDQPTIHKNLAILFVRQGKLDQAIEHYRQVLRFRPNDRAAYEAIRKLQAGRKILETPEKTDIIQ